jgi:hypothetical protein
MREAALAQRRLRLPHAGRAGSPAGLSSVSARRCRALTGRPLSSATAASARPGPLHLIEQLKELPREDPAIEDLIYDMKYAEALGAARAGLQIAREMHDKQGLATYSSYIERLERLVASPGQD